MVNGYQDCYDISESIPQAHMDKNPMKKKFGRQMMFFKCADVSLKCKSGRGALTVFTI